MDFSQLEDNQLVRKVMENDKELYSILVQRYQNRLYPYIFRLTNNREESADILQEVFLKAYKNLKGFNQKKKFSSWIYRIAHNESVNWLKKNTKFKKKSIDEDENKIDFADKTDLPSQFSLVREKEELIKKLDQLPIKYKEVLILRYLEEKSYEEIGEIIKKSQNAVGILITRAKKKLKELYNEEYEY